MDIKEICNKKKWNKIDFISILILDPILFHIHICGNFERLRNKQCGANNSG
jgi:hypothetical protein